VLRRTHAVMSCSCSSCYQMNDIRGRFNQLSHLDGKDFASESEYPNYARDDCDHRLGTAAFHPQPPGTSASISFMPEASHILSTTSLTAFTSSTVDLSLLMAPRRCPFNCGLTYTIRTLSVWRWDMRS